MARRSPSDPYPVSSMVAVSTELIPANCCSGGRTSRAREGLIVVDTGRHAAHTQSIVDFAKEVGQPAKAVINTHWHLDHIGGIAARCAV